MTGTALTPPSRRPRRARPVTVGLKSIQGNVVAFGSPVKKEESWRRDLKDALGTVSDPFVDMTLQHLQAVARLPGAGISETAINGALAMMRLRPRRTRLKPPWPYKWRPPTRWPWL